MPASGSRIAPAMLAVPIAFMSEGERFVPVAVQGLMPGQNLLVASDGRWLSSYIPAPYRVYPFRMMATEKGEQLLCINEANCLSADSAGKPFFNEDGSPSESVKEILNFSKSLMRIARLPKTFAQSFSATVLSSHGLSPCATSRASKMSKAYFGSMKRL